MAQQHNERRVVITGMGTINPLGHTVRETWDAVLQGRSGIGPITRFDTSRVNTTIAGEVRDFDYLQYFEGEMQKKARRMDRFCQYAAAAMVEAGEQAGLASIPEKHRIGICYGSGIGGLTIQHENSVALETKGPRRVSPFYVPLSIGNMAAGIISMIWGITGPNIGLQTACATANHSIAMAQLIIRSGMADVMVTGGAESTMTELSLAGFGNMHALSTRNESPETASRPYDRDRDGFVLSEGAAVLILEEYEHARARGAEILAEVCACGMSGDAHDFVAPDPQGRGAALAMNMALEQARITPDVLGYINTHGTSTPVGDIAEIKGIHTLIRNTVHNTHVGSTKSMHGHLLGAAAGIEAIITVRALQEGKIPANINLFNRDPELPPVQLPTEVIEKSMTHALSNSFGFGGHNSSLILARV